MSHERDCFEFTRQRGLTRVKRPWPEGTLRHEGAEWGAILGGLNCLGYGQYATAGGRAIAAPKPTPFSVLLYARKENFRFSAWDEPSLRAWPPDEFALWLVIDTNHYLVFCPGLVDLLACMRQHAFFFHLLLYSEGSLGDCLPDALAAFLDLAGGVDR